MQPTIPENNKKEGICYAVTDSGLELPVIDITHPAFKPSLSESEQDSLLQQFLQDLKGPEKVPAFFRKLMFNFMSKRSVIMRGLMSASGTFMSSMNTYMMKLGDDNLNQNYFSEIDRRIAASAAGMYMRLRLQDIVHLLSDALLTSLSARPDASLRLLNIGGGPAMDSLNALILIRKERPELLAERQIFIYSLDMDTAGADFGTRALASLQSENGPLHNLDISFTHIHYNWSNSNELREHINSLNGQNVFAISSEGALFEYGSGDDITSNLRILSESTPADTIIGGSVTRADDLGLKANGFGVGNRAALQFRGLETFTALALRAGWKVATTIDRPLSHDVLLKKV